MKIKSTNWMGGTLFKASEEFKCSEGTKKLQLIIDGEASEEQEYMLMNHINECKSCSTTFTFDKTLKEIIRARITDKPCPPHLMENIRAKLAHND